MWLVFLSGGGVVLGWGGWWGGGGWVSDGVKKWSEKGYGEGGGKKTQCLKEEEEY